MWPLKIMVNGVPVAVGAGLGWVTICFYQLGLVESTEGKEEQ